MERTTRQGSAIRNAIDTAGRPLSPLEVLAAAQVDVPGLGIATVYRNLKHLVDSGAVAVVSLPGEVPRYERAHQGHHHHFQCTLCQRVFDVHHCPGNLADLAPAGFTVEGHELTLYGRCAECAQPKARARGKAADKPRAARRA